MKLKLLQHSLVSTQCVIPENIHTSPTEGIFSLTPLPLPSHWKFQLSFIHFLKFLALHNLLPPRKFQSFLWGEYGYFLELYNVLYNNVTTSELKLLPKPHIRASLIQVTWLICRQYQGLSAIFRLLVIK